MSSVLASAELAARSGRYAVTDGALVRNDEVVAGAPDRRLLCVLDTGDRVLVGTDEAHLLELDGDHLVPVDGFERAEGRTRWYTPWGGPPDVRSMAAARDGTLYLNVHVGGVLRSTDGGATWEPTPLDIDVDVHRVLAHDDLVLAACGDGGLATSRDGGETWSFATGGLHGTYCRSVAVAGGTELVTASTGPFTKEGAVYRRPLGSDAPFERVTEVFPFNIDTFQLAGARDGRAAFGTEDGRVYLSTDEGATWELVDRLDGTVRSVELS
jgi:photosystem II stability/assembly factor-like uncharacterized protein